MAKSIKFDIVLNGGASKVRVQFSIKAFVHLLSIDSQAQALQNKSFVVDLQTTCMSNL